MGGTGLTCANVAPIATAAPGPGERICDPGTATGAGMLIGTAKSTLALVDPDRGQR
jgi:hypothetical protein